MNDEFFYQLKMGCGHSFSSIRSNNISPSSQKKANFKDSNEDTLKEENTIKSHGLGRRPSILNTPQLQTVQETSSNVEEEEAAFKKSEIVAGRKISHKIHGRAIGDSSTPSHHSYSSISNIMEENDLEKVGFIGLSTFTRLFLISLFTLLSSIHQLNSIWKSSERPILEI